MDALVELITCPRCGQQKPAHATDKHLCVDCVKAENSRYTYYRQNQDDWLVVAKENGLDPWLQQPEETQWEYTVWSMYRDSYPGKKPSYGDVAIKLGTTYNVVSKISKRWSFHVRMQHWMKHVDEITMLQRRDEILNMNAEHISMAQKLRDKLSRAIDHIDPDTLKPGEIASLAKVATEMERKAQIDTMAQEDMRRELLVDNDNPNLKKQVTKQSDLSEIVGILTKAGALGPVGVRQTTEVVMMNKQED